MSNDHRDQVEELLGEYRRSREQLASAHRELMSITESAASQDGLVSATVGPHGRLVALTIADSAYRRYRPAELAAAVVRATGDAAAKAVLRAQDVLGPVLPADTDPDALLAGRADLRPEEIAPPAPARPVHGDDEDSFEHLSWMDVSRPGWPT